MSFDSNANFSCLLFVGASFWMHSFPKCFSLHYFYYIELRMLVFPSIVNCVTQKNAPFNIVLSFRKGFHLRKVILLKYAIFPCRKCLLHLKGLQCMQKKYLHTITV